MVFKRLYVFKLCNEKSGINVIKVSCVHTLKAGISII
jgi:hypothetical protein